jgi:hypothetical protein
MKRLFIKHRYGLWNSYINNSDNFFKLLKLLMKLLNPENYIYLCWCGTKKNWLYPVFLDENEQEQMAYICNLPFIELPTQKYFFSTASPYSALPPTPTGEARHGSPIRRWLRMCSRFLVCWLSNAVLGLGNRETLKTLQALTHNWILEVIIALDWKGQNCSHICIRQNSK